MFLIKKWGILIKKESESLIFTDLKIPRDYYFQKEGNMTKNSKIIIAVAVIAVITVVIFMRKSNNSESEYEGTYTSDTYGVEKELVIKGSKFYMTTHYSYGDRKDEGKITFDGDNVTLHVDGEEVPGKYDSGSGTLTIRDEIVFKKKD